MSKPEMREVVDVENVIVGAKTRPKKTRKPKDKDPLAEARKQRSRRLLSIRKRDRLRPALMLYDAVIERLRGEGDTAPERTALSRITDVFRGSFADVKQQIIDSGKLDIQITNSIKRSAGTNFQSLCEYGVIRWLDTTGLPLCIQPNAPKTLRDQLTIHGEDGGESFQVEPDIDICIWKPSGEPTLPIVFISAKTSLVDRAGAAARWKLYLDLHQTTCPHTKQVKDCPIHATKVMMQTSHPIEHCIVTANIYKIDTTQPEGELKSGQCKNNTYMFRHRYTTRNDALEFRPPPWRSFSDITELLMELYSNSAPKGSACDLVGHAAKPPDSTAV